MCAFVLGLPEHKVRVIAPDVGGGFGSKIFLYAEDVAGLGEQAGRPADQVDGRAQRSRSSPTRTAATTSPTAELALDKDGKFLALRVKTIANVGAYLSTFASCVPTILYATLLAGQYKTPAIYCEVTAVFTNTAPVDAYRGAGPARGDLRRRAPRRDGGARDEDRPGRDPPAQLHHASSRTRRRSACTYDTGDYDATSTGASRLADVAGFAARKAASRSEGQAARPRLRLLHRGLRHRAVERRRRARRARRPVRGRRGARASDRQR